LQRIEPRRPGMLWQLWVYWQLQYILSNLALNPLKLQRNRSKPNLRQKQTGNLKMTFDRSGESRSTLKIR
jgi:hypothetical protein